jgi:hypothetical protein
MRYVVLLGMLLSAIPALTPRPVQAHDIYGNLLAKNGESCCHDSDCRPAPWRIVNGEVQMFVESEWVSINDELIQYRTLDGDNGKTNGGHWCGIAYAHDGSSHLTFCAVLPPRSSGLK